MALFSPRFGTESSIADTSSSVGAYFKLRPGLTAARRSRSGRRGLRALLHGLLLPAGGEREQRQRAERDAKQFFYNALPLF